MKVTIHKVEPGTLTIRIEGRIAGRYVAELDRAWREAAPSLGDAKLRLDIRGVTYLDESARHLLAGIFAQTRATFLADTPLTKYFAEQAQENFRTEHETYFEPYLELKARK